jgi:ferredoxin-NADP reductase
MQIETQVTQVVNLAQGIVGLRLSASALPSFEPGAHIDAYLGNGLIRQYSLTNPLDSSGGATPTHYDIAVGLAAESRGGSSWIHRVLRQGMKLKISAPRNHFALNDSMRPALLVAGGIGVTPIRAMVQACDQRGRSWRLFYAARSRTQAAYAAEFETMRRDYGANVECHFDDEHSGQPMDLQRLSIWAREGADVFCCGPSGLMTAVRDRLQHSGARLHFEWFSAAPAVAAEGTAFDVVIASTGQRINVPKDISVLDALEAANIVVAAVCKEGICGTCECRVRAGSIDHRCQVLTEEERARQDTMMVCVSRASGSEIVLDL